MDDDMMASLMEKAKQIQSNLDRIRESTSERTVEAHSGGGMVKVVVTGKMEVVSITIDPEAVNPNDVEMLEDLILSAVNQGLRRAQEMVSSEVAKVAGGLPLKDIFS